MAINGEIRQLYADREKTKPIYPRVSSNAVVFESGNSLKALEASVQSAQFVTLKLEADGWSDTEPYTQTASIPGMTADWVPGVPVLSLGSSVDVSALLTATEALGCIKMITSAAGTLTFTAPEDKPGVSLTLRVPGMVGR